MIIMTYAEALATVKEIQAKVQKTPAEMARFKAALAVLSGQFVKLPV